MKGRLFITGLIVLLFVSCKNETNNNADNEINKKENDASIIKSQLFKNTLLDYRDIDESFTPSFQVNGFGMKRFNDSIYAYVLKLKDNVNAETVKKYSIGFKSYHEGAESPINATFSPEIEIHDESNFLIMKRNLKKIEYFDSLDVYIYARNNWKASGRIGSFKIIDVLFEKEKK